MRKLHTTSLWSERWDGYLNPPVSNMLYPFRHVISALKFWWLVLLFGMNWSLVHAQLVCECTDYLYVNDPTLDITHKFIIDRVTGGITGEVDAPDWLDPRVVVNPHGVAGDVNGNLYIAQLNQTSDPTTNQLFQLDCEGNVLNDNVIPNWISSFNLTTIGNTLYAVGNQGTIASDGVYSYDLCSGQQTAFLRVGAMNEISWGMSLGLDGNLYVTSSWSRLVGDHTIYRVPPDLSSRTIVATIPNTDPNIYALGVTQDEFGNLYLVTTDGVLTGATTIYKFDAAGNIIHSISDTVLDEIGFGGAWGIKYYEPTGKLYIGTLGDDCVAVIDAGGATGNMVYQNALGVPHEPGAYAKAINIVTECCPQPSVLTIEETLCEAEVGDVYFLQDLTGCTGTICGGDWSADTGNVGFFFDDCRNTIEITAANACGSFVLSGNNSQCGAYEVTINIETGEVSEATVSADQTVCPGEAATLLTATGATGSGTVRYQWQSSTTDCNSGFANIPGAISATYDPGVLPQTTYFRVITSVDGGCGVGSCTATSNCVTVTVRPRPSLSLNDPTDQCENGMDMTFVGSPVPGSFSSSATAGFIDNGNSTALLDVSEAGAGTYDVVYTHVDANNCTHRETVSVTVNATPQVNASAACDPSGLTYTITATTTNATDLSSSLGTVSGTAPNFTVSDIPAGSDVVLTANNALTSCTFMLAVSSPVCITYTLGSTVFEDQNNNGLQDAGDMGIPEVLVVLYQDGGDGLTDGVDDIPVVTGADGIVGTADDNFGPDGISGTADDGQPGMYTDMDGNYFFAQLPAGDFYVQIPASEFGGGAALEELPISSNTVGSFAGETDPDDNVDNDDEGIQPGGGGTLTTSQLITLSENAEPTDADTETAQGNTQDNADDANGNMTLDFGFFTPVSLGDTTFVDLDRNGLQDIGDPPVAGVTVTLYFADGTPVTQDAEGNPVTPQMTDANGYYQFTNLSPGDYYVVFDLSTVPGSDFYAFTTPHSGDEANDSDADPLTGQSDNSGLIASGENFPNLDAGIVCILAVDAGVDQTICSTTSLDLSTLNASYAPDDVAGFGATWTTDGDGTFDDGAGVFGVATTYQPGAADIAAGQVILRLTTDDPSVAPFNASFCGPVSDELLLTILLVDCGNFPWDGN